jgi:hypothetical protein
MKNSSNVYYWIPRILCILAITFVSIFALDAFVPGLTVWQQIGGFLIHLIPSFVLIVILAVAWKWEYIGGIIFTLIGLIFSPYVFSMNYHRNHSIGMSLVIILLITIPFIIIGFLFIISQKKKKNNLPTV